LEALAANELASESDLFIFSDGPRNEQDEKGVHAVREYIRTVKGFKSVHIVEHEKNQGLAKSLIGGITELCDKLGEVIVVEDDILTSPYFLWHGANMRTSQRAMSVHFRACWNTAIRPG